MKIIVHLKYLYIKIITLIISNKFSSVRIRTILYSQSYSIVPLQPKFYLFVHELSANSKKKSQRLT